VKKTPEVFLRDADGIIVRAIKSKLATTRTGRIILHTYCLALDHKVKWHWAGIVRELKKH